MAVQYGWLVYDPLHRSNASPPAELRVSDGPILLPGNVCRNSGTPPPSRCSFFSKSLPHLLPRQAFSFLGSRSAGRWGICAGARTASRKRPLKDAPGAIGADRSRLTVQPGQFQFLVYIVDGAHEALGRRGVGGQTATGLLWHFMAPRIGSLMERCQGSRPSEWAYRPWVARRIEVYEWLTRLRRFESNPS